MFNALKVVRIITILFFLGILSFSYAYLPLTLDLNLEGIGRIGRGLYFYTAVGSLIVLNLITYFLRFYVEKIDARRGLKVTMHALAPVLFFSLTLLIGYVTVINNEQDVNPSLFYYLNYLSMGVIVAWILSLIYVLVKKI